MMEYKEVLDWKKVAELSHLLELKKVPSRLFFAGDWNPSIFENCAAVVGSRRVTQYGRWVVEKLVAELVRAGKTIVSGFMYGVDQCAHEAAMELGGKTIAVLGWGMQWKLLGREALLAVKIMESGGLFLSEWENQAPTLWTFPVRNRIVAALASAVYVVEAAEKSGSLITVNEAVKLGRKIYAVPGPLTSRVSFGTNTLIASGKATAWLPNGNVMHDETHKSVVFDLIKEQGGLTADEMARILGRNVAVVGAELTQLLLMGVVAEREGKYYLS